VLCLCFALLLPIAANAEKALIAQQSVEVKASPKAVWAIVKNFNGLHKWHPAFKDDVINPAGITRRGRCERSRLGTGESFDEQLLAFGRQEAPLQIQNCRRLAVSGHQLLLDYARDLGQGRRCQDHLAGDVQQQAGSGKTDEEVVEMLNGAYKAGLDNVKKLAEHG
jgi:mxaD protein